ncbi:MAG: hypothetical protein V4773_27990 [Verrucomicrobiota bacterium]
MRLRALLLVTLWPAFASIGFGWGFEAHQTVTRIAFASLPEDFPAFARSAAASERVVYLANIPDRWRNVDPWLKQSGGSWSDHFLDIEHLAQAGLDAKKVPSLRYNFILIYAAGHVANSEKFPSIDPKKNADHTQEWPGFAPWAIAENFAKLRSAFSYLKAFREVGGTPEEIANAEADAIYAMGVLSHYIGDCSQPLHTTHHHNGWIGENPNGYTVWPGFHSWIDSGFLGKAGVKAEDLLPRATKVQALTLTPQKDGRDPFFVVAMDYILEQHTQVEPLYKLEKAGQLGNGQNSIGPEARTLMESQLLKGGQMLARAWLTAWHSAPVDTYLRTQLGKRREAAGAEPAAKKQ